MNSLPKTVTRQRRHCDSNAGPSAPESSTLKSELTAKMHSAPCGIELKPSSQQQTARHRVVRNRTGPDLPNMYDNLTTILQQCQ